MRYVVWVGVVLAVGLTGCAGPGAVKPAPDPQARVNELADAQARQALRLEELTRNLLALRQRLDAQEAAIESLRTAKAAAPEPELRVVKLEPPEAGPGATVGGRPGAAAAELYRRAFNAYREGSYGQAILDFEEFLRDHPEHDYADNAQYWIGESYYSQGEFQQAAVEFGRVVERYPREAKAPDAQLKLGLCYQQMGDLERARAFWQRLVEQRPDSEAAREALTLLRQKP